MPTRKQASGMSEFRDEAVKKLKEGKADAD